VDLSAASTRPGKRRPAATAAGIEPMHLEERWVRGQAHPRSPLRPWRARAAQDSTRPPALIFLAPARPAKTLVGTQLAPNAPVLEELGDAPDHGGRFKRQELVWQKEDRVPARLIGFDIVDMMYHVAARRPS